MASEDMVRVTPATARCLAECESASANSIEDTPISWLGCAKKDSPRECSDQRCKPRSIPRLSASSLSGRFQVSRREPPLFAGASRRPGDARAPDACEIASRDCALPDRTPCWTPVRALAASNPRLDDRAAPRGRTRRGGKIRGSLTARPWFSVNRARSRARFINRGDETEGRETRARTSVDAARHGA